ncbi:DDHD domain-containing protein [Dichotomocladium elegans]|nr:DDHD domain-containing protein [Dichotomocladium elegans]
MFFDATSFDTSEFVDDQCLQDYENIAGSDNATNTPNDHVIFVIHGIGQQTEQYGMFAQHMQSLRDTMSEVLEARLPNQDMNIKMIPIEWHRHIHQQTDATMSRIVPKSIPTVRMIETDYLADVLYYFSHDRGESILQHVAKEFNAAYDAFILENPGFCGKIAVLGYSLGGLITWDLLAHQRANLTPIEAEHKNRFNVKVPRLNFIPDYLFGMGCPVAGLLVARNQDPRYYRPHDSIVFENIYHPYDPAAFRMEPLMNEAFKDTPAATVERAVPTQASLLGYLSSAVWQWFGSSSSTYNDPRPTADMPRRASEGDILRSRKSTVAAAQDACLPRSNSMPDLNKNDPVNGNVDEDEGDDDDASSRASSAFQRASYESTAPSTPVDDEFALPHGRRIDYELTPETGMMANEYILGLSAHFSYWKNKDLLWHVFCRMESI